MATETILSNGRVATDTVQRDSSGNIIDSGGSGGGNVNLTQVGSSNVTLGQKTSANSLPVVLPSDQVVSVLEPPFKATGSFTRPNNTTQYSIGDALSDSATAPTAANFRFQVGASAQHITIETIEITTSSYQPTLPSISAFLLEGAPTTTAWLDNALLDIENALWIKGCPQIPLSEISTTGVATNGRVRLYSGPMKFPYLLDSTGYITILFMLTNTYTPVGLEAFNWMIRGTKRFAG